MQKEFLVSVAGGLLSALMTSAILLNSGVGILLGYFGLLPIIFVGFSSGLRYLAIASCFCIASLLFFSNQVQAILYFFSMVIPAILICYLVLSRRSINAEPSDGLEIGQVLAALALLGITYLLTSLAFFTDGSLNLEERIKEMLNKSMSEMTGQTYEKIEKDTDRDYFLSAEEAKNYGLIDRVITHPSES